jgi:hypothetical protein
MYRRIFVALLVLALIAVVGCSDDDVVPDIDGLTIDDFPMEVGNFWVYEVIDTVPQLTGGFVVEIDTVTITAVDTLATICDGRDCWGTNIRLVFDDGTTQWEAQVVSVGDTLFYDMLRDVAADYMVQFWSSFRWNFPLQVGKTWSPYPTVSNPDKFTVVERGVVSVPNFTFPTGYTLHRDWSMPNAGGQSEFKVVPNVGIVKHHFSSYCTVCYPGSPVSDWTLINWFGNYDILH